MQRPTPVWSTVHNELRRKGVTLTAGTSMTLSTSNIFHLDVQSWDELRERHFKEFAPSMYHFEDEPMIRAFKKVFDKWLSEAGHPRQLLHELEQKGRKPPEGGFLEHDFCVGSQGYLELARGKCRHQFVVFCQ